MRGFTLLIGGDVKATAKEIEGMVDMLCAFHPETESETWVRVTEVDLCEPS